MSIEELEKTMQELKDEAASLGVEIKGLKSKKDVKKAIDDFYESQAADDLVKIKDEDDIIEEDRPNNTTKTMAQWALELKGRALKTKVVTITSNDQRDNHLTSTVYLSCENQYWGISKIVPLNEKVELEQGLIDCAKDVEIMLHIDEIIDGVRTGNKTMRMIKKYSVSYED